MSGSMNRTVDAASSRLLTVAEATAKLEELLPGFGWRENKVYALSVDGLLPCVRVGRLRRWRESDLVKFAEQGGAGFAGGWRRAVR